MRWTQRRWARFTGGVLLAWLVAREFGIADFALARTAARHGASSSVTEKLDGRRRMKVDRDDPLAGMQGLRALNGAAAFMGGAGGSPDDPEAAAKAKERETQRRRALAVETNDRDYAEALAAKLHRTLEMKLAADPRLAGAKLTVDVVYAARRGFAWVPLWKEVGADVAVDFEIVPSDPALPTLDAVALHSEWQSIHGSSSRRHALAGCDAMVIERIAAAAAASARDKLAKG
jgi:hypothetical protein